jgi:hypothetical protein
MITQISADNGILSVTAQNPVTKKRENTCVTLRLPNDADFVIRRITDACKDVEERVKE